MSKTQYVIRRRYVNGIKNLFGIYIPIVDEAMIFDNSIDEYEMIAEKKISNEFFIYNNRKFTSLKSDIVWNQIQIIQVLKDRKY